MENCTMSYKLKIEDIFAFMALITGLILILIIPPMCSPDENSHFLNAYALASGNFFPVIETDGSMGRYLPKGIVEFTNKYNSYFQGNLQAKYSYTEALSNWLDAGDFDTLEYIGYWNADVNLIAYFPSAFAMSIYQLFCNLNPGIVLSSANLLLIGRMGNLLFYVFLVYHAIQWVTYKKTILFISLSPVSIYLASSLSYDTIVISFTIVLLCRITYLMQEGAKVTVKDIIIFSFCSFFLCNVKQVYAVFLLCLFAIPIKKFKNRRQYITSISAVALSGGATYLIYKIVFNSIVDKTLWNFYQPLHQQSGYLLHNFLVFIIYIFNSCIKYGGFYFMSLTGCLGQLDCNLPVAICYIIFLIGIFILITEFSQVKISVRLKLLNVLSLIVCIYLIFAGTYIIWTSHTVGIGATYIDGVQGRYFIPLILPMGFLIGNRFLINNSNIIRIKNFLALLFIPIFLFLTILFTFMRYWL